MISFSLGLASLIVTAVGAITGILTLIKAVVEYTRSNAAARANTLLEMRTRLREDKTFHRICELLETDDVELSRLSVIDRDRFLGLFEELALLRNSGVINSTVTMYMFGYYAVRCLDSKSFWIGLNRDQPLWSLFIDFARDMKAREANFRYDARHFKL